MPVNRKEPLAIVSESTRFDGRTPASKQVELLKAEKHRLSEEKKSLEMAFSDLEVSKRKEIGKVISKNQPRSMSIAKTNDIEIKYREKRKPLINTLHALEERINDIKGKLWTKKSEDGASPIVVRETLKTESLVSIAKSLRQIVEIMNQKAKP